MRHALLQIVTAFGTVLFVISEGLSAFGRFQRAALIISWFVVVGCVAVAIALVRRRPKFHWRTSLDPIVVFCVVACLAIVAITATTAIASPPNSSDAMAYHMPRVVYWAEQGSVRFFPTPYLNQIMLQPFAEYVMLHLYVLSGGDSLTNLVQWFASLISIVAVSLTAGLFGAAPRGQAIAALFCATLPSGILASSGAKNDYVLAMWIIIAVCFAIRFASSTSVLDAIFLGASIGLASLTKATAYLFLPCLILTVVAARWRQILARPWVAAAAIACALAINGPHFSRNFGLSGSIMGFDSAFGDSFFRWRNETFGWKQTASNAVRNLSEQLGARSERWNRGVYDTALWIHQRLGIDPNDSATTWPWVKFGPPKNANHEADAPNRLHLAALFVVGAIIVWKALRGGDRRKALYVAALVCGFLAFCVYLKWQPFMARMFLPLFVAASPMAGILGELKPKIFAAVVLVGSCLLLLDVARPPLLENWVRPLKGASSVTRVAREDQYFADLRLWNNKDSYVSAADFIGRSECDTIGIDINKLQLEYPLIALVRDRKPSARFLHTGVANPSRAYRPPVDAPPCMIACLDCSDDPVRLQSYGEFGRWSVFGKFVVLSQK